jgi:5-carboxymethyl-2-hydroxymuconic-semialdehyde dehydrogenase
MNQAVDPKLAANLSNAARVMARFRDGVVPHLIAGEKVAESETFDTLDPTTNEKQATVAAGGSAEIDRAARAAEAAFRAWRDVPGAKRRKILHAVADAIEARPTRSR